MSQKRPKKGLLEEPPEVPFHTLESYLAQERRAEGKSEYLARQIFPVQACSPEHTDLVAHLTITIGGQLRETLCHTLAGEIKIRTAPTGLFAYPDLAVFCGQPRFHDHHRDVLVNPAVLFEVYSPATEAFDRGRKFACYQQVESLTDYVLIAQEEPRIEHYARQSESSWLLTIAAGPEAVMHLDTIDCTLSLSELYNRLLSEPPGL